MMVVSICILELNAKQESKSRRAPAHVFAYGLWLYILLLKPKVKVNWGKTNKKGKHYIVGVAGFQGI